MKSTLIPFEATPSQENSLKLFRAAYEHAYDHQEVRDRQCERDYQLFHAYLDMSTRNPDRANVAIPKIWSILMTKVPRETRAAIGKRPYIPFETKRPELQPFADSQVEMLDALLELGGFQFNFVLCCMLKALSGTSFLETFPYYEKDIMRVAVPDPVSLIRIVNMPVERLRFRLTPYGIWEVKVDPFATGLETEDGCRYVVKTRIESRRKLYQMAVGGAFGKQFDADTLLKESWASHKTGDHKGLQILGNMGMTAPGSDGDIGVMFRYESPTRYIDVWNDEVVLRDIPNPFAKEEGGHGLINLSRFIHNVDPHTQAQFWGNGEAKVNEIAQSMLNDLFNIALDNHNMLNQGITYYDKATGVTPEELVHAVGNKIGLMLPMGSSIDSVIKESYGQPLPPDHYALRQVVEDYMDMASGVYEVQRGEKVQGDHTLGEISMLKESGDSRQELDVKLLENPTLRDIGNKALCHMDQWARHEDKVELLGEQRAMSLLMLNPKSLPGGFDYTFKGSDRVVNQALKQQALMTLDDRVGNSPYTRQRPWLEILMRTHDLGDEVDAVLMSEEEFAMNQAMMAQQSIAMNAAEENNKAQAKAGAGMGQRGTEESRQATDSGRAQSNVA